MFLNFRLIVLLDICSMAMMSRKIPNKARNLYRTENFKAATEKKHIMWKGHSFLLFSMRFFGAG